MSSMRYAALSLLCASFSLCAYQDMIYLTAQAKKGGNDPFTMIQTFKQDKAVVLFHKPSCPFCVFINGKFKTLAKQNKDKAQFVMINIANDSRYGSAFGFSTVPTVAYFKNGKIVAKHGSNNKSITLQQMQTYVNKLA